MHQSLGARTMPMPAPVWVVGTYDADGKANIMTASWAGICCSTPPCVYVALRRATHSYGSIAARQAYTVSVPSAGQVRQADFAGLTSGRNVDKFARTGLTAIASDLVDAPYVAQFPVVMECRLRHTLEIGLHTQFIGEVLDVKVASEALGADGSIDLERVAPFVFVGGQYRGLGACLGEPFAVGKDL
jgi:flavin reductase (DIM6/NTAB) family NADH-FMN oxidoreductase RutF